MSMPRPSYEKQAAKIRSLQTHNAQLKTERDEALELAERAITQAKARGQNVQETQEAVSGARGRNAAADAARACCSAAEPCSDACRAAHAEGAGAQAGQRERRDPRQAKAQDQGGTEAQ